MNIEKEQKQAILDLIQDAGRLILSAHDVEAQKNAITVKPGAANFVTVYDVKVQQMLIDGLGKLFPDAYVFAEEKNNAAASFAGAYCFVIDPIDGTTNFIHDMKRSVISVALFFDGAPVFGAVYDPYMGEMFSAAAGEGAFLNGRPIRVSDRSLDKALVSFGTSPYNRVETVGATFRRVQSVFMECADIRRSGTAALDVCYVACGRTDAYFEDVLSPWDYAAGMLILREAGGTLTDYSGNVPLAGEKSSVLCSNKLLHPEMLQLINQN